MDNYPLYEEVIDPYTGLPYAVDPITGQVATITDKETGEQRPAAPRYDPASRVIAPAPRPGQTAQTPSRVPIDASGRPRPELTSILPTAPATAQPVAAAGSSPAGGYGSGGYSRGGYGGYSGSGYGGYSGGGGYDDYGTTPRYANNARHPYFGGDPLTPGGVFAQQSAGYDNRVQVTVPSTGASAGPFGVTAPRSASSGSYGGGGGSSGGGGGGIARDLYWHFANKIKDRVMGGGTTATSAAYPKPERFKPYRGPEDPRTQRRVEKLDARRASQGSTMARPDFAIPKGVNLESTLGDRMQGLPGFDLTLIAGAGKKNWAGGMDPTADIYNAYYKKLGKRLDAGRPGIDFYPFYKKELRKDKGLDQYNKKLQSIYQGVAQGRQLDTSALFGNLTNPKKGTYLNQQFKNAPAGLAATQYGQSFDAILNSGEYSDIQRTALAGIAQDATTRYGQRYAGRNPRRTPSLARWMGRQIGGYFG